MLLSVTNSIQAQFQVTSTSNISSAYNPITLISNVFIGQGMDIDTIIYEGSPQQVGYFQNAAGAIGIPNGIIISSGNVESATNANTSGSTTTNFGTTSTTSPLTAIATGAVKDLSQYTIVFTPTSSTLSFNYVFASEEYPEWVGSTFNDVFGFFISGPNNAGPFSNIAIIPGTPTPVSINNVNAGSNATYYNSNTTGAHEYDGYTTVMTATANVIPCQQYTIILAVSDVGDNSYDSGVFLEAGSFTVDGIIATPVTPSPDTVLVEGCASGSLDFNIAIPSASPTLITYTVGGTATMGVDYANIPASGLIPAGSASFAVTIVPLLDNIAEPTEYVEFIFNTNPCTLDTVRIYIQDNGLVTSVQDTFLCLGTSGTLDATSSIPIPPPYSYSVNDSTATLEFQALQSTMNISGFPFPLITAGMIESICLDITHLAPSDLDIFLIAPDGKFLELSTDNGALFTDFGTPCFKPTATAPITSGTSPFSGDFQPEGFWNFLYGAPVNGTWKLQVTDDGAFLDGVINGWSINFAPIYDIQYSWTPTTNINSTNTPVVVVNPTVTTDYVVTLTDTYGCTVTDTATVFVDNQLPAPVISCGNTTNSSIEFVWAAVPNAVSYEVNVNNTGWVAANGVLSHILNGLASGTSVTIQVRAVQSATSPCTLPPLVGTFSCMTTTCALTTSVASLTNVTCFGGNNGSVTIAIPAGVPPYSLSINNGIPQAATTFSNLAAGTYTIVITDSVNCQETETITIADGAPITITFTTTDASCNGNNDGTAMAIPANGTAPYAYTWNTTPTQTLQTATNLAAGNYVVTVTDANMCSNTATTSIGQPWTITATITSTNVSCNNGTNGTITISNTTVGNPALQYSIDGGITWQVSGTFIGLTPGIYIPMCTFLNGTCQTVFPNIIITEPTAIGLTTTSTDATCNSSGDGTATVVATGGTGAYAYAWSTTPVQTLATATGLNQGTFTVTVTDANMCTATTTATVAVPSPIVLTMAKTDLSCFGASDGTATVTASGGAGGTYNYAWNTSPAQITATATNLSAGTYIVTVSDSNGCFDTAHVFITGQVVMTIGFTHTDVTCNGGNDGTATVNITNGNAPFTYAWSNGQTSQTVTSVATTIICTITDVIGCLGIDSVTISEPTALVTAMDSVRLLCFGDGTGKAFVTASGGTAPYTYLWEATANSQTTDTASNLMAGTYFVTVTDANNCTSINSVEVTQPMPLILTSGANAVSCSGGNNGLAYVIASGGTYPYYYTWNDAGTQVTDTAFNLLSSNYLVFVTDINGCEPTDTIFVPQPAALAITLTATPVTCFGGNDGTASVVTTGGVAPYTFAWNSTPVQTTASATSLVTGWVTVIVTDANNCDITDSIFINEPTPIVTTITGTDATCNGATNGTATVTATGGDGNYTYTWDGVPGTNIVTNLGAGSHYVTVSDGIGCSVVDTILINEPTAILVATTMTAVSCNGNSDGTATAIASGGAAGFSYQWNSTPAQFTVTATGLATGNYTVTVTDMNGCFASSNIQVTTPNPLTTVLTPTNVACFGTSTGNILNAVTGGVPNYTFLWNNGATTPNLINITAGTYTVTITDANGCNITATTTVTQPTTPISIIINTTDVSCHGGNNGSATATVTGGTAPYTYQWNSIPGQVTATASGLVIGTYTVIVTDANNCSQTATATIQQPSNITAIITEQSSNCFGAADGMATVTASGGSPGYTYVWNTTPQQTGAIAINLMGGQTYTVTITDTIGCTKTQSITITQPTDITLTTTQTDITCNGYTDGTATVLPSGGNPGYTFLWGTSANNQTTATANNLGLGTYSVTVTDFSGCTASTTVTIIEPNPLFIISRTVDVNCKGNATGIASAAFSGGTAPYFPVWSHNNTASNEIIHLPAGTYYLTLTDANSCQLIDSVMINEPAQALDITALTINNNCYGDRKGEIKLNGTGGTYPYQFSLNGQTYSNSNRMVGLKAGNYNIYARDSKGCLTTDSVTITEPAEFTVEALADININFGDAAVLGVTPTNGIDPILYVWTPDTYLSCDSCIAPIVDSLVVDTYFQVFAIDSNGCEAQSAMFVRVSTPRYVFIANAFTPNGDGVNDVLYVQGGSGTTQVKSFQIFDRWGELVYNATDTKLNDTNAGWDGTYKGEQLNGGIFVWIVDVEFEDGRILTYRGSTMLMR